MSKNPSIREIVRYYLEMNGFDGLWCAESEECACDLKNLFWKCDGEDSKECKAGYIVYCDASACDCDFHILETKPETTEEK